MPKTMEKPTHYTTAEGGSWEEWPFGYLNTNNIKEALQDLVELDKHPIYAIKLSDDRIWDNEKNFWSITASCKAEGLHPVEKKVKPNNVYILGDSLIEANKIINGERQDSYGNPEDSFSLIAEYWNSYLRRRNLSVDVRGLTALDVAHMMTLFKIARCQGQSPKRDNYIDIQGYAAIAADRLIKE